MTDAPVPQITNTADPLFELDVGFDAPKFAPRSWDELIDWLTVEDTCWQWIDEMVGKVPDIGRQRHHNAEVLQWSKEGKASASTLGNEANTKGHLDRVRNSLEKRYRSFHAVHSSSPRAKFLETIADPLIRAHTFRTILGFGLTNPADVNAVIGAVMASVHYMGVAGLVESHSEAARAMLETVRGEHEALRRSAGELEDEYRKQAKSISDLHKKQDGDFHTIQTQREEQFGTLVSKSNKKMEDLERAFEQKTATKAPVKYFKTKARNHSVVAGVLALLTLIVGWKFASYAYSQAGELLKESPPSAAKIAVAVLLATLGFWLLRILVRSLLGQMHLATDCRSRAMLLETYIALLKDGQSVKDEDRKIILGVLFRPMAAGLIRDDAAPPGVWDVVTRNLGGSGKT